MYICTYVHMYISTYLHIYIYAYIYIFTYIHIYICTLERSQIGREIPVREDSLLFPKLYEIPAQC